MFEIWPGVVGWGVISLEPETIHADNNILTNEPTNPPNYAPGDRDNDDCIVGL